MNSDAESHQDVTQDGVKGDGDGKGASGSGKVDNTRNVPVTLRDVEWRLLNMVAYAYICFAHNGAVSQLLPTHTHIHTQKKTHMSIAHVVTVILVATKTELHIEIHPGWAHEGCVLCKVLS